MKTLTASVLLLMAMVLGGICMAQQGSMMAVEKLTPEQHRKLTEAGAALTEAQAKYAEVQKQIAAEHGFKKESYMEWRTWYEFDGDFIIKRYQNNMAGQGILFNSGGRP